MKQKSRFLHLRFANENDAKITYDYIGYITALFNSEGKNLKPEEALGTLLQMYMDSLGQLKKPEDESPKIILES